MQNDALPGSLLNRLSDFEFVGKNSLFEQRSGEFGIFSLSKFKPSEDSGEVGLPFFGYFLWRSKESDK
ncbi:hypothetical protein V5G30_09365 [Mannheimia haemolytica]